MQHAILQPCADATAQKNYAHTVERPVSLREITPYLTSHQKSQISSLYPAGQLRIWGITDGKKNTNRSKWEKICPGDVVFFAWGRVLHSYAAITATLDSKKLSKFLWQDDSFHNIYLLGDFEWASIPCTVFNKAAKYKENFLLRGFIVLNKERSSRVLEAFSIGGSVFSESISSSDCKRSLQKILKKDSLDKSTLSTRREEQTLLRRMLFGGKQEETCALCGKKYPVKFLTAAHIKRRTDCSLEERKDVPFVVMPVCKFGCDELYERGYLLVEDGKINLNEQQWITDTIFDYVEPFKGRHCPYWNDLSKRYFEEHNAKFKK